MKYMLVCIAVLLGSCSLTMAQASSSTGHVIYQFSGGVDGGNPHGPLTRDPAGNLYGAAESGGTGYGVIFELSSPVHGTKWTETVLYTFTGKTDGAAPNSGLVFDATGNLYGTAFDGGNCFYYCGTVWELSPPSQQGGTWTFNVLFRFNGPGIGNGGAPNGSLIFDEQGNLYGTAQYGGENYCSNLPGPCGVVFELSPSSGGTWTEKVLYSFQGPPDGEGPYPGVIRDKKGNLYGVTGQGGTGACTDGEGGLLGCGMFFELSPQSGGGYSKTTILNVPYEAYVVGPSNSLSFGPDGSIYTISGYVGFKLSPPSKQGGKWTPSLIYEFPAGGINGTYPDSGFLMDSTGNLYGVTNGNALEGYGTIYKLSPQNGKYNKTVLQSVSGGFNSNQPNGDLIFGLNGLLYGTTSSVGGVLAGSVYEIQP